jgi:hypothetical protein
VTRLALVIPLLVTGCFYIDPINERPSIGILPRSSDPVFRGDNVALDAQVDDPDGDTVDTQLTWHAYLCTDATDPSTCDLDPAYYTSTNDSASFVVPITRADGVTQVTSMLVQLDAVDDGGAHARPSQQLVIPIGDRPPDVTMRKVPREGYVIGTDIEVSAKYTDLDDIVDGAPAVTIAWDVLTPAVGATFTLVDDAPDLSDPLHPVVSKILTPGAAPDDVGEWTVQVTATDPENVKTIAMLTIDVVADHPPCIAELQPVVPPAGVNLPISEATAFSVPLVIDDLDVYPPNPQDPVQGVTSFAWSIKLPGQTTRQPYGTGASVELDPSSFHAGDVIELRVEIDDRQDRGVSCADTDPTCSVISDPTCLQRQTWEVEIR